MKTSLLLIVVLALLGLSVAKPHNEGKRPHLAKRSREHKLSNRMDHHRREHGAVPQHRAAMHRSEGGHKNPSARRAPPPPHHDINKDIHLQHVTEHNIDKKHEDKDGIPMEPERLIPVTPRPPKVHKVHHKPSPATPAPALHNANTQPTLRPKAHRPPKKYSPKKHGWKKTLRKDKMKDKVKEKREKRDKKNKALHRAIATRKL